MKSIVTGYDGSEPAERALLRAAELAGALQARLVVVSVGRPLRAVAWEPVPLPLDPTMVPTRVGGPLMAGGTEPLPAPPAQEQPDEARLLLEQARRVLTPRRVEADYVAETGHPTDRLLQVADDRDAELIVVGCPHHSLLDRLLGHGVDEELGRRAHRDVLLVH
jgi:nucleotide-binding universal stress UspA family protein